MIGLNDLDGKIPNLALMKLSSYYKSIGEEVELFNPSKASKYDKIHTSCLFTWNKYKVNELIQIYGDKIVAGGTGWEFEEDSKGCLLHTKKIILPSEVESLKPDYDLYTSDFIYSRINRGIGTKESKIKKANQIANMGIGFTSRGCIRNCQFCIVPKKEGKLRPENEIKDILNPRSNIITLLDNNFTADPNFFEKVKEIRERNLIVDISQGIDIRLVTEEKAIALNSIKHLRSIHYAWDLMESEESVFRGIKELSKHIKPYRQMCFVLVDFNTTFEQDMYRVNKLREAGIKPFIMIYNKNSRNDLKLKHFSRWVNGHIYKACDWVEYKPYLNSKSEQLEFAI